MTKELTPLESAQIEAVVKRILPNKDFQDAEFLKCIEAFGREAVMLVYKRLREQSAGTYCHMCNDTGMVVARRDELEYVFRCGSCKKAEWKKLSSKIPEWSFRLSAWYTRIG